MQVTIRIDDITPDMNRDKFNRFKEALLELDICPIIGVVPDCRDELLHVEEPNRNFWDEIRNLADKGWIVAMHGYRHIYSTGKGGLFPLNRFSEFAGVDYAVQKDMLTEGLEILKSNGVEPQIFMAPGHTFDANTVKVLKELGFTGITDGFGEAPYKRDGLIYYPIALQRGKVFTDKPGRITLVYHLNTMTDEAMDREIELLKKNRDKLISFTLVGDAKKQSKIERLKELSLANMKRMAVSLRQ